MNNKYQKERCTNSSIHNPFFVTNCIEEIWTTTMIFCPDGKINGWLDCRMCGLPTGGKPESLHRGQFIFVSQVFSKQGSIIQGLKVGIVL